MNSTAPQAGAGRWLPFAAGVLAAGSLLATIFVFAIMTTLSSEPVAGPVRFAIEAWFGFLLLGSVLVFAGIVRMREVHPVPHDAAVFDVLFAFAAAVLVVLLFAVLRADDDVQPSLRLSLTLGMLGFAPLVAVRLRLLGGR